MSAQGGGSSVAVGSIFQDRYEIIEKLSEGGFGTVYKAKQRATGQLVAIKVLRLLAGRGEPQTEKRIARFRREMQLSGRLSHPNVVRLIDTGETPDGVIYTVFEFVPGKNLADVIEEGPLGAGEARHFMLQILDALASAHRNGIVHRDLKPANIMIVPTGARRNAVVLDFGIAALAGGPEDVRLTGTAEALGTPGYSAPEQLKGMPTTPRSDLYAWGLVYLECLAGTPVFTGRSVAELIYQQVSPDPVPIPAALAGTPLGELLRTATQKNPEERAVSADALLGALQAMDLEGGMEQGQKGQPGRGTTAPGESGASAASPSKAASLASGGSVRPSLRADRDSRGVQPTVELKGAMHPAETQLVDGERRQITVLCCRIASSAGKISENHATGDHPDDERILAAQTICIDAGRRFGGYFAGALGDELLLYFGHPAAHEDDARRAAGTALAIAQALAADATLGELAWSLGLHTGFVVVRAGHDGSRGASIVGLAPRVAAQVARLGTPGSVTLTGDVRPLLRNHFVLVPRGVHSVDGADRPLPLFALTADRPGDVLQMGFVENETPLVGRREDLATLAQKWALARDGEGQCAYVSGEPGIGKSRLIQELERQLRDQPHRLLECRCAPDRKEAALSAVVDMLERLLEFGSEHTAAEKADRIEALLTAHDFDAAEVVPLFCPLLSVPLPDRFEPSQLSPQKKNEATLGALVSLLFEMAAEAPLLFVVEDLHWADSTTLKLLGLVVAEVSSGPICAILTGRPEFTPSWPGAKLLHIQLGRLLRHDIEAMVSQLAGGQALPAHVLDQVVSRTDGVPLFVEELTRMVVESAGSPGDGTAGAAGAFAKVAIPMTLRESLMARLDRLGRAKETAQIASALGREFGSDILAAISPRDPVALEEDIEQLVQAELLQRRRRARGAGCMFKHALVRDTAYESMAKSTRREVHARIATIVEKRFPELAEAQPERMKLQFASAALYPQAIGYALKAAQRASQSYADADAEQHLRDAKAWLEELPPSLEKKVLEVQVRAQLGAVLMVTRGFTSPDLDQLLQGAVPLVTELGDGPALFPIRYMRWTYLLTTARHHEAYTLGLENLEVATRGGVVTARISAHMGLGAGNHLMMGRSLDAIEHMEAALRLYQPSLAPELIVAYGNDQGVTAQAQLGLAFASVGRLDAARAAADEAVAMAERSRNVHARCTALAIRTQVMQCLGDREEVKRTFALLQPICAQYSVPFWEMFGQNIVHWADMQSDDEAVLRLEKSLQNYKMAGANIQFSYWYHLLADGCLMQGRLDEGLGYAREGLDFVARTGEGWFEAQLLRLRGELLWARGDQAGAEASLKAAVALAHDRGTRLFELRAALALAHLYQKQGHQEAARSALAPVVDSITEGAGVAHVKDARALLSQLG